MYSNKLPITSFESFENGTRANHFISLEKRLDDKWEKTMIITNSYNAVGDRPSKWHTDEEEWEIIDILL